MLTTTRGFKKPQTSDPSSALRTSIGDNADKAEASFGSANAVANGNLSAGWTINGALQYRKVSEIVFFQGNVLRSGATLAADSSTAVFTLPVGFRPPNDLFEPVSVYQSGPGSAFTATAFVEATTGTVRVIAPASPAITNNVSIVAFALSFLAA